MAPDQNTAVFTAIAPKEAAIVPFNTLLAGKNPANGTKPGKERKKGKPGKERGVSFEHGKWVASAGFRLVDGNPVRNRSPRFETRDEAVEWRSKQLAKKVSDTAERRVIVRQLADFEAVDAAGGLDVLAKAGFQGSGILKQACQYFVARHPEVLPTTVAQFFVIWIKKKADLDRRLRTIQSAKSTFAPFLAKYGHVPLVEITLQQIEDFVFDSAVKSRTTRRNRGVVATNFFNLAQKRGLIGAEANDHPCFALELPTKEEGDPDPWPVGDFEKLLGFAWNTEDLFHCTAYVACGAYAGIRTEELLKLRTCEGQIDIDKGLISVPRQISKKGRERTFEMEPCLQRLLTALRDRPVIRQKHVRPLPRPTDDGAKVVSPKLLHAFKEALKKSPQNGGPGLPIINEGGQVHRSKNGRVTRTESSVWRHNGLRASFASYHYERQGEKRDARVTAGIMGHKGGLDVFFNHYRKLVKPGEGNAFFAIADKLLKQLGLL